MFEGLGDRIQGVFKELRGEGHLTEYHLETALRQIRLSLLEADVALPVVRAVHGARPGEGGRRQGPAAALAGAGGHAHRPRRADRAARRADARTSTSPGRPAVLALVGLQGSGKTTSAGKLALHLKSRGRYPLLVAADLARPGGRLAAADPRPADRNPGLRSGRAHATRSRSPGKGSPKRG